VGSFKRLVIVCNDGVGRRREEPGEAREEGELLRRRSLQNRLSWDGNGDCRGGRRTRAARSHLVCGEGRERVTSSSRSLSLNMTTSLDWLKQSGTIVVSDSGDFECMSSSFVSVLSLYHNSYRCLQTSGRYHEPFAHPRRCWQTRLQPSHRHRPRLCQI